MHNLWVLLHLSDAIGSLWGPEDVLTHVMSKFLPITFSFNSHIQQSTRNPLNCMVNVTDFGMWPAEKPHRLRNLVFDWFWNYNFFVDLTPFPFLATVVLRFKRVVSWEMENLANKHNSGYLLDKNSRINGISNRKLLGRNEVLILH